MPTPARIAANRQNAQKSTGPRTEEGKARSSRNATRHGLYARDVIVTKGDFPEDAEDFERLQNDLIEEFAPAGPLEQTLVERLAVSFWRLRRAYRFEVRAIGVCREHHLSWSKTSPANYKAFEARPRDEPLPLKQDVDTLVRYESMIDREIHRTLNQLQSLRKNSRRPPPSPDTPDTPGEDVPSPKRQRGVSAAPPSTRANSVDNPRNPSSAPAGRAPVAGDLGTTSLLPCRTTSKAHGSQSRRCAASTPTECQSQADPRVTRKQRSHMSPWTRTTPLCISRPAGGRIFRAPAGRKERANFRVHANCDGDRLISRLSTRRTAIMTL